MENKRKEFINKLADLMNEYDVNLSVELHHDDDYESNAIISFDMDSKTTEISLTSGGFNDVSAEDIRALAK